MEAAEPEVEVDACPQAEEQRLPLVPIELCSRLGQSHEILVRSPPVL
jgi:hypothetical protein